MFPSEKKMRVVNEDYVVLCFFIQITKKGLKDEDHF